MKGFLPKGVGVRYGLELNLTLLQYGFWKSLFVPQGLSDLVRSAFLESLNLVASWRVLESGIQSSHSGRKRGTLSLQETRALAGLMRLVWLHQSKLLNLTP